MAANETNKASLSDVVRKAVVTATGPGGGGTYGMGGIGGTDPATDDLPALLRRELEAADWLMSWSNNKPNSLQNRVIGHYKSERIQKRGFQRFGSTSSVVGGEYNRRSGCYRIRSNQGVSRPDQYLQSFLGTTMTLQARQACWSVRTLYIVSVPCA